MLSDAHTQNRDTLPVLQGRTGLFWGWSTRDPDVYFEVSTSENPDYPSLGVGRRAKLLCVFLGSSEGRSRSGGGTPRRGRVSVDSRVHAVVSSVTVHCVSHTLCGYT